MCLRHEKFKSNKEIHFNIEILFKNKTAKPMQNSTTKIIWRLRFFNFFFFWPRPGIRNKPQWWPRQHLQQNGFLMHCAWLGIKLALWSCRSHCDAVEKSQKFHFKVNSWCMSSSFLLKNHVNYNILKCKLYTKIVSRST